MYGGGMYDHFPRGIKIGIKYQYFSRYRFEVGNSSIVTTLLYRAVIYATSAEKEQVQKLEIWTTPYTPDQHSWPSSIAGFNRTDRDLTHGTEKCCSLTHGECLKDWFALEGVGLKGIVHFEINFWYVLAYLKGIQDVSALFPQYLQFWHFSVKPLLSISNTLEARGVNQKACTEKSKLNMI